MMMMMMMSMWVVADDTVRRLTHARCDENENKDAEGRPFASQSFTPMVNSRCA